MCLRNSPNLSTASPHGLNFHELGTCYDDVLSLEAVALLSTMVKRARVF
jgi:hypothetical protein